MQEADSHEGNVGGERAGLALLKSALLCKNKADNTPAVIGEREALVCTMRVTRIMDDGNLRRTVEPQLGHQEVSMAYCSVAHALAYCSPTTVSCYTDVCCRSASLFSSQPGTRPSRNWL